MNRAVTLVPSFSFEGWRSMEIYAQQVYGELSEEDGWQAGVEMMKLEHPAKPSRWERLKLKYFQYPFALKKRNNSYGGERVIHHLDHGYAHLVRRGQRSVVTVHDLTHFEFPELSGRALHFWRWRMSFLKNADHLVAVTHNVADLLEGHLEIDRDRISVGYHEVKTERFINLDRESALAKWRGKLGRDENELLVASVGTDCPKKNLEVTLRAVLECLRRGVSVKLVRCGDELKDEKWTPLMEKLVSQNAIVELGYVSHEEVAEVLSVCDVLSFPSKYEGFGMPIMEAQALSLPVIAARCSCLPEVAGDGAWFHEADDAEELADLMVRVISNPDSVAEVVEKGLRNVERFKPGNHMNVLKSVYKLF